MPAGIGDLEARTRERAYFLWLHAGSPDNLSEAFWAAAHHVEAGTSAPWPVFSASIVKDDNAKIMLERADAMIKSQDEGMRAMEGRMTSLLGITVTLITASIAAVITASLSVGTSATAPVWVQPWTVLTLSTIAGFWFAAILVGAFAMMGRQWSVPGVSPTNLYRAEYLAGNPNRMRLLVSRALQRAIDDNRSVVRSYSRLLTAVIFLLVAGPVSGILVIAWSTRTLWLPEVHALAAHILP
jgi:hypothetical protein